MCAVEINRDKMVAILFRRNSRSAWEFVSYADTKNTAWLSVDAMLEQQHNVLRRTASEARVIKASDYENGKTGPCIKRPRGLTKPPQAPKVREEVSEEGLDSEVDIASLNGWTGCSDEPDSM